MISPRLSEIIESPTIGVMDRARALRQKGVDVVDFGPGEPDFTTPRHILEAGSRAILSGDTHYTPSRGIPALRRAIASKLEADNGVSYNPDREIIVTASSKLALVIAAMTVLSEGDEALVLDPSWVSYAAIVRLAGATPIHVALDGARNFQIDEAVLEAAVTPRTKLILLNSPNNPTGRVNDRQELDAIAAVARRHGLLVLSDEIYEKILFDGREHVSLASLPGMRERTITINGFSKNYAMTGWRLGYLAAEAALMSEMLKVQQHTIGCAASFVQAAAVEALEGPQEPIEEMRQEYQARRDLVVQGLNAIPGVQCHVPQGTFYAFPRVADCGFPSSADFAEYMLGDAHVAITPGEAFGDSGRGHVRLSFATSREEIEKGLGRMAQALERHGQAGDGAAARAD